MVRYLISALLSVAALSGCSKAVSASDTPEEIDAISVAPERFKLLLENESVRVIEFSLAPGEKDTPHTHPPKVSYVVSGGKLLIHPKDSEPFDAEETSGGASWDEARGWHFVENVGDTPVRILLVEVKSAAKKQ